MDSANPQVDQGTGYSPLSNLMANGLAIFGDGTFDVADGSLAMMLLQYANVVVTEVNAHPYRDHLPQVPLYLALADRREIPDQIVQFGLAAKYADQQSSSKAASLMANYYRLMNQTFWLQRNGNTPIETRVVDNPVELDANNGLPITRNANGNTLRGRSFYPSLTGKENSQG